MRDAHASDEWVTPDNVKDGISFEQPRVLEERRAVATVCADELEVPFPVVVDDMDDSVSRAYGAWPDRLFVLGADGRVIYLGGPGPFGFLPDEVGAVLEALPE